VKLFGFSNQHTLLNRAKSADVLGAVLCGLVLAFRLMFAEEDFSYDYSAYIYYFDLLSDYSFLDVLQHVGELFPYVVLPRAPIFEFGFVLIAKAVQAIVFTSTATYSAIAGLSVGARTYVMRKLGCSWLWILLSQLYVVTLLEANAIRVGVAVTVVLYGLYYLLSGRKRLGWTILFLSLAVHLQSVLFVFPFAAIWPFRKKLERSRALLLALVACMAVMIIGVMSTGLLAGHEKLSDYTAKESSSGGLTIISISAAVFLACALFLRPDRKVLRHDPDSRLMWMASSVAIVPSVVLYTAVTSIAAIGDRSWQFSFVIFAALVQTNWISRNKKVLAGAVLATLAMVAAVNVLLRYPLSNLFDFVLPHVDIEGQV
jgi:hypothetical protein